MHQHFIVTPQKMLHAQNKRRKSSLSENFIEEEREESFLF
jgi:hypothetical protein